MNPEFFCSAEGGSEPRVTIFLPRSEFLPPGNM
jgi:hypothetical protein